MFEGSVFAIVPLRLTDTRKAIFEKGIRSNKGHIEALEEFVKAKGDGKSCNRFILVEDSLDENFLKKEFDQLTTTPDLQWVKTSWISACLKKGKLVETDSFTFKFKTDNQEKQEKNAEGLKRPTTPTKQDETSKV